MSKKLFVGNLPFDVNDSDLSTVLAVAGTVVEAKVIINKKTGRSKGYGFVEMETEEMAKEAVLKFEGATLNERPLTVQSATPKQEADAKEAGAATEGHTESHTENHTVGHADTHSETTATATTVKRPAGKIIFGAKVETSVSETVDPAVEQAAAEPAAIPAPATETPAEGPSDSA